MNEAIIVVALVLLVFGIFYVMAHKAEQVVKAQKAEEQKLAVEQADKPGRTKKR